MSDLKLVPSDQPTPFEQRLLDAVAQESPSAEQRARVRLTLGLPAVASPPAVLLAPAGRRTLLLKAGGGLVVVSAAVLALLLGMGQKSSSSNPPPASSVALETAASPSTVASTAPSSDLPTTPSSPLADEAPNAPSSPEASGNPEGASASSTSAGTPLKRSSKPALADGATDLSEQLRLIDAARAAVAARNVAAASAALSSYRTRFPRGPFVQEAAVLQIETLDLQGNHAAAAAQARSFLARYPNSPHVSVVRRIAGL